MALRHRFRGFFGDFELLDPFFGAPRTTAAAPRGHAERALRDAANDPIQRRQLALLAHEVGASRRPDVVEALVEAVHARRLALVPLQRDHPAVDHAADAVNLSDLLATPPQQPSEDTQTSFEVRLVDELGEPLSGVEVKFTHEGSEHPGTTDGDGVARLDVKGVSFAAVTLADQAAVNAELEARWDQSRSGEIIAPSEEVEVHFVREGEPLALSLVAKALHTVSLQQDVRLARLLGFHFDTNKSFLLPSALPNIRALTELYAENPGSELMVVGHAAPDSEADDADDIALERAESVAAYLQDDVDLWLTRYDLPQGRRWGGPEDQLMIKSLADFPEKPLGENSVRWFQRTRGLSVDGIAGTKTRTALITEYMGHDGTLLPDDVTLDVHGCGAEFPLPQEAPEDQAASDRHSDQEHRRVELFFFAKPFGVLPSSDEYAQWLHRSRQIIDLTAEGSTRFVTFLEMADVLFRTNSCVVAPEGEDPSPDATHPSLSTLGLVATALQYAKERSDKRMLVAGHCDTTASAAFNQPLSEERAGVALAMLLGQRQEFADLCQARHKVADYKQILSWVSRAFDPSTLVTPFDCDPGTIDDVAFTGIEPVRRFQAAYNRNKSSIGASAADLAEDGAVGPATWGALFDCYEHALRLELKQSASAVQTMRDGLTWVDDNRKALGFSEHHPIDNLGRDGFRSQANRRVEILFFDPGEEPDLDQAGGAPEMSDIYLPGRYERGPIDPNLRENLIAVRLCDPLGTPIPEAPYSVTMGRDVHHDVADADGFMEIHVPSGLVSLVVEWSDPAEEQPELAKYTREVVLEIGTATVQDDRTRAENLGYEGPTLAAKLDEYRAEFGRGSDVTDEQLREEIRNWHDGGERPVATSAAA